MPEPGERVGTYVVETPVGAGGMGVVYRARDKKLGRLVALKLLREEAGATPEDVARFLREARLAAALSHPGVVRVLDVGEHAGLPFIALEWIDGASLFTVARQGSLPLARKLEVLTETAEIVAAAHAEGVVHRDLKPANIMIDRRGVVRVLDFGIAKRIAPAAEPHPLTFVTRDDVALGTPSYMAPEQERSPRVDARADQFAWGVMAYELLAHVHPRKTVGGQAAYPAGVAPLSERCPELPGGVTAVVARAMAERPEDRFPDMMALLAALRAALAAGGTTEVLAPPPAPRRPGALAIYGAGLVSALVLGGAALALVATRRAPAAVEAGPVKTAPAPVSTSEGVDASQEDAGDDGAPAVEVGDGGRGEGGASSNPAAPRAPIRRLEIEPADIRGLQGNRTEIMRVARRLEPALGSCAARGRFSDNAQLLVKLRVTMAARAQDVAVELHCRTFECEEEPPHVDPAVRECTRRVFEGAALPPPDPKWPKEVRAWFYVMPAH